VEGTGTKNQTFHSRIGLKIKSRSLWGKTKKSTDQRGHSIVGGEAALGRKRERLENVLDRKERMHLGKSFLSDKDLLPPEKKNHPPHTNHTHAQGGSIKGGYCSAWSGLGPAPAASVQELKGSFAQEIEKQRTWNKYRTEKTPRELKRRRGD